MKYSESLKKNKDFQKVYSEKKSYANKYLVMYTMKNNTDQNRLGISVSKKVGGYDIVVIARVSAKGKDYHEIEKALLHLAHLHKIIDQG